MNACGHDGPSRRYVDDSNDAITRNSPALCGACYAQRHGTKPMVMTDWSPVEYGVLGLHNLLSSGDYIHRNEARARFTVRSFVTRPLAELRAELGLEPQDSGAAS